MELGLLDTYYLILELPDNNGASASRAFSDIFAQYDQGFLDEMNKKFDKIVCRRKIRNESEWYLVRSKVDELMHVQEDGEKLERYQELLDDFEKDLNW